MKQIARALAFLLALLPAVAAAQTFPTVPSGTVIGRTAVGTGPAQAIPISSLIASMLNPLTVTSVNTASVIYRGSTSGTATVSAQPVAGTPAIKWPTQSGTVPTTATLPLVLDAVTGNLTCPTCSLQLETRTAAAALNLSAYNVVRTLGYATAGDGGGAFFKKVGSTPFQDSRVLTGSITAAGSSYTNGTYRGVPLTGGTGSGLIATVVVSGNAVTSVTITGTGGNAYSVNDVLTTSNANIGGTGSGFTWTVATISSPLGSFTDAGGAHWQIIADPAGVNIRQFGAKQDWLGTDASATNDYTAIQAALNFAGLVAGPTPDAGGITGAQVLMPKGASLICGGTSTLLVPGSVVLRGMGVNNSTLKLCDSGMTNSVHVLTICDPETQKACFGGKITEFTMYANNTPTSAANIAMVYSNNVQQLEAIDRIAIYSGLRSCIKFETGYGGAAYVGIRNAFCTPWPTSVNPGISINYGTTVIGVRDTIVEAGGSGATINGLQVLGGFVEISNFHAEGISSPVFVNIPTSNSNGIVRVRNITGGNACTSLVTRQTGSGTSTLTVASAIPNGCTNSVNNAGALTTTIVVTETVY